jgi:hypothetical protein
LSFQFYRILFWRDVLWKAIASLDKGNRLVLFALELLNTPQSDCPRNWSREINEPLIERTITSEVSKITEVINKNVFFLTHYWRINHFAMKVPSSRSEKRGKNKTCFASTLQNANKTCLTLQFILILIKEIKHHPRFLLCTLWNKISGYLLQYRSGLQIYIFNINWGSSLF